MATESRLLFVDLQNDEDAMHIAVWAANGNFQGMQDIYIYREQLNDWARELTEFGKTPQDKAVFEYGSDDPNFYARLRLTAFIYESRGASALEVLIDNHSESPYQCRVEFCIFCAPAELNELGAMILDWDTGKNLMMEWTVENSV